MKKTTIFWLLIFLKIQIAGSQTASLDAYFLKNKNLTTRHNLPTAAIFQKNFDKKFDLKNLHVQRKIARPMAFALPKWSADELPFFCKIEHLAARNLPLPVKFRLGSVNYVDWLEGKSCTGSPDF